MQLISALVASAYVLHASGFLLPLEVSKAAEQAKSELASLVIESVTSLDLDCPGCPFFGGKDATQIQSNVENKIHLEFTVNQGQDLTINGQPVLPKDLLTTQPYVLKAPQIQVDNGQQTPPLQLDFAVERLNDITATETPGVSITPLQFTIFGIQGQPVKVDTVSISLLTSSGQTSIARISTIPFKDTPGASTCDTSSTWSVCRLRAILAARLRAMVLSAKARAHGMKGWVNGQGKGCPGKGNHKSDSSGMTHTHGHGHGHGSYGGHHYHHAHRLGRMLHQTLRFFVIPALLGIIGGLLASAVGMMVGQLISFLRIRSRRASPRGDIQGHVIEIVVQDDEKDTLLVEGEVPPPQYQDLDVEAVLLEEEKK